MDSVRFWLDTWHAECSLATSYRHVFELCTNQTICVQEVLESRGAMVRFRRILHGILLCEWHEIVAIIHSYTLTADPDVPLWKWDPKQQFTTSWYCFLSFRGVQVQYVILWWQVPVPLKVRVFMWLLFRNKILTKSVLKKKEMAR